MADSKHTIVVVMLKILNEQRISVLWIPFPLSKSHFIMKYADIDDGLLSNVIGSVLLVRGMDADAVILNHITSTMSCLIVVGY